MNPHELDSVRRSLETAMRKLEALGEGHAKGMHRENKTSLGGVPRTPNPPVLYQREHHLSPDCSRSSTTFRGIAKPSTLPLFTGESSRSFVTWLYAVECFFQDKGFSDEQKCDMVVTCLRDFASLWYNTLNLERAMERKGRIRSWAELHKKMRLKYLPCSIIGALWLELRNLKQQPSRLHEYAKLFEELHFVCGIGVDFVKRGVRSFLGLKPENADIINLEGGHSFDESLAVVSCEEEVPFKLMKRETSAKGDHFEATKSVGKESGLDLGVVKTCLDDEYPKLKCMSSIQFLSPAGLKSSCTAGLDSPCPKVTPTVKSPCETTIQEKEQAHNSHDMFSHQSNDLATYGGKPKGGSWTAISHTNLYSEFRADKKRRHLRSDPQLADKRELSQGWKTKTLIYFPRESHGAELRGGTPELIPFTILIYDPGGNSKTPSIEVVFKLLQRLNLLKLQGDAPIRVGDYLSSINKGNSKMSLWLCANSEYGDGFQEGEDAAGALGLTLDTQGITLNTTNMPKKSQSQTTHKRSKPQLIAHALLKPSYEVI